MRHRRRTPRFSTIGHFPHAQSRHYAESSVRLASHNSRKPHHARPPESDTDQNVRMTGIDLTKAFLIYLAILIAARGWRAAVRVKGGCLMSVRECQVMIEMDSDNRYPAGI